MKEIFKLKHLDLIIEQDNSKKDFATLMREVLGYKNSVFGKAKWFVKNFLKIKGMVAKISSMDYSKMEINENSIIKKPVSVDHVTYLQMLELQSLVNSNDGESMSAYIARVIAITTYGENRTNEYKADSPSFNNHLHIVLNQPLKDMVGLYNWILKDIDKTSKDWQERFLSVEVTDNDFTRAGGDNLQQFNVLFTIKTLCKEFNVSEKEAWHISYYLAQTNSYATAYQGFIQENIRIAKEAEIKAKSLN